MSIASRITSIEEHIGNAYKKIDDLGIDLTGVDKNIENISEMLDTVYEEYPKVPGQGTEVTLNGTKVGKLGLDEKGNSTQETTTGINLLNPEILTLFNNKRYISTQNYATQGAISVEAGEIYSLIYKNNVFNDAGMYEFDENNTRTSVTRTSKTVGNYRVVKITFSNTAKTFGFYIGGTNSYITIQDILLTNGIMFIKGDYSTGTLPAYEPYSAGQSSPSPSYEQLIYSAGEDTNLWGGFTYSRSASGVDFVQNTDGTISANGTPSASVSSVTIDTAIQEGIYKVLSAGTYSISGGESEYARIEVYDSDKNKLAEDTGAGGSFTLSSQKNIIARLTVITQAVNKTFKIKLQKGSKVVAYSPYNMGALSKTIKNKNFFVPEVVFATKIKAGTVSINSQGQVVLNGTFNWANRNFNVTLPPGEYIGSEPTQKLHFFWTGGDNYLERGSTVFIMTAPQTISGYIQDGTYDNVVIEPMIYLAPYNASQEYIKGQEQTYTIPVQQPMRSIGTVRDEFIQDEEGNWFERHNIGHYVFTGTENWGGAPSVVTGTARFYIEKSDVINDNTVQIKRIYSNRFKALTWDEIYQSDTTTINAISNYNSNTDSHRIVIRIDNTIASTKTELNTYLSNNETYADYVLSTPVDLPCTAEQIAILENLPKSYNEQTNIYSLDVTPAYVEAKALKGE